MKTNIDTILDFDELNILLSEKFSTEQPEEAMTEILESAFMFGVSAGVYMLRKKKNKADTDAYTYFEIINPEEYGIDEKIKESVVDEKTADKTYKQRVEEYISAGDINGYIKTGMTEYHRIFNEAIAKYADKITGGKSIKRWETMQDDKVRDTHAYLQGQEIPLKKEFYTYDGDHAYYPGGFQTAENNVNCRCWINVREDDNRKK